MHSGVFFDAAVPVGIILLFLTAGFIGRRIIFRRFTDWAKKTHSKVDDIVIESCRTPFILWCLMAGILVALQVSSLPPRMTEMLAKFVLVMGIVSVSFALADVAARMLREYSGGDGSAVPAATLLQTLIKAAILLTGFLLVLNNLGISITPFITALGVGGLAVALALQETLTNFFSGFYISIARQIKIGDYVRFDSGYEGFVTDIGWRNLKIRSLENNIVMIPNAKASSSIVTNFFLPDKGIAVVIDVSVGYDSDLEKVENVTRETAVRVMKEVNGEENDFAPLVRFQSFGDSGINVKAIMKAKDLQTQFVLKHEFIKSLHAVYKKEGIVIPYPSRSVYVEEWIKGKN